MDWDDLVGPAIVAAAISGMVSLIGMKISTRVSMQIHTDKLGFDQHQAERRLHAEIDLAERKARAERDFAMWKRRAEFAEQMLVNFFEARTSIEDIRRGWPSDFLQTTEEAFDGDKPLFGRLAAQRIQAEALFGAAARVPYEQMAQLRAEISTALSVLSWDTTVSSVSPEVLAMVQRTALAATPQNLAKLGLARVEDDPIVPKLESIISAVANICSPVLNVPSMQERQFPDGGPLMPPQNERSVVNMRLGFHQLGIICLGAWELFSVLFAVQMYVDDPYSGSAPAWRAIYAGFVLAALGLAAWYTVRWAIRGFLAEPTKTE